MMYDSAGLGGPPILKFSKFASSYDIYDKIHEMATEHTPTEAPTTAYRPNLDHTCCVTANTLIVKMFNTINKALFVTSWTTYLEQKAANKNLLRVKHFIPLTRAATATTTTAIIDVDNIDITNTQSVESHIEKCVCLKTKKQTKNLEKEIQTLKRAFTKNNSRGANCQAPPTKRRLVKSVAHLGPSHSQKLPQKLPVPTPLPPSQNPTKEGNHRRKERLLKTRKKIRSTMTLHFGLFADPSKSH
ncbi:unnamed protein product [Cylindrotheca closterium]|uniref:Uncharacterized protein n=1 Tax=Cylindrotheca closterium TaxID=2856 RepID=A0AAD2CHC2_9STRA|nr:unnamed protein product [Cylindrotheca closterium]